MRLLLLLTLLAAPAFAQKVHRLKAAKETVQWGWLDPQTRRQDPHGRSCSSTFSSRTCSPVPAVAAGG
jgi:hypothetical protein